MRKMVELLVLFLALTVPVYADNTEVYVAQGQSYSVRIPAFISMDSDGADFVTVVKGDIAGNNIITVQPDREVVVLSEDGGAKNPINATIIPNANGWVYDLNPANATHTNDVTEDALLTGIERQHNIRVNSGLTAGTWRGIFNWNISCSGNAIADSQEEVRYHEPKNYPEGPENHSGYIDGSSDDWVDPIIDDDDDIDWG